MRLPYQSDPTCRKRINAGRMDYIDIHLSHVAQHVWFGFLGKLDIAIVEVAGIREDGSLIPSSSIGNNKTWLDLADKVILEVNSWQDMRLEGMHDIYYGTQLPPHRKPIPIVETADRIGEKYFCAATRRRSSPSSRPICRTAIRRSPHRTKTPRRSPATFWNFCVTR